MASLQPVGGKLGDRLGRRPMMLGGIGWFAAASVGAALSTDLWVLVACRVQQGVAGALIVPNGVALLREVTPEHRLGGRLGLVSAALTLGAAAGLPLGGALVGIGGWPMIFTANLPLLAVALAAGWRSLPRAAVRRPPSRFDLVGAVTLSILLAAGTWLAGADPAGLVALSGAGILAAGLALFLTREARHPDPVLQPRLFARPAFSAATAGVALSNLAMYVTVLALPLLLAGRPGWSSLEIGLAAAALPLSAFGMSPPGGRLSDRVGRRLPAVVGLAVVAAGLVPLALAPHAIGPLVLVGALVAVGVGMGLSAPALQTAAIEAVEVRAAGVAAGVFSTCRYLGSICGTSLLAGPLAPTDAGGGFDTLFTVLALIAAASAAVAVGLPGRVLRPGLQAPVGPRFG
jgi:MFS family permease